MKSSFIIWNYANQICISAAFNAIHFVDVPRHIPFDML